MKADLVILCQSLASARSTSFDLTSRETNREVGYKGIFSFTTSMRSHHSPVGILCQFNHFNGLGHCPNLVNLNLNHKTISCSILISHILERKNAIIKNIKNSSGQYIKGRIYTWTKSLILHPNTNKIPSEEEHHM
jgi:hypothetical protein